MRATTKRGVAKFKRGDRVFEYRCTIGEKQVRLLDADGTPAFVAALGYRSRMWVRELSGLGVMVMEDK